jgi:hypothetical protein
VPDGDRESGDPFQADLTPRQVAVRLEGRKLVRTRFFGDEEFESLYRVDLFRQWLPRRGMNGILQFYGIRATRRRRLGERWTAWKTDDKLKLHTVEREGDIKIK